MTMPPAPAESSTSTLPGTLASGAVLEPAAPSRQSAPPPSAIETLDAQLQERMDAAEIGANAQRDEEAGIDIDAARARDDAAAANSLVRGPFDETAARLDEVMAQAEIAANAQRDVEAEDTSTSTSLESDLAEGDGEPSQSTSASDDAAVARQIAEQAQGELNAIRAANEEVLAQLAEVSGFTVEGSTTKYDRLFDKAVRGTASAEERTQLAEMTATRQLVAPVYAMAEQHVLSRVTATLTGGLNAVVSSGNATAEEARAVHAAGVEQLAKWAILGRRAALGESAPSPATSRQATAQPSAPAETRAARPSSPQADTTPSRVRMRTPEAIEVTPTGPPRGSWLAQAFNADGSLNADFESRAKRGEFLGVDLAKT